MTHCTHKLHGYLSSLVMAAYIKGRAANDNDGYEFLVIKGEIE